MFRPLSACLRSGMENKRSPRAWHPLEYAHVFLWLVKDMSWAQGWKTLGSVMVFPTLMVAFWITWSQRHYWITLVHNLAISLWILSNSIWMLGEMFDREDMLKPYSTIGFGLGLLVLLAGYLRIAWQKWGAGKFDSGA